LVALVAAEQLRGEALVACRNAVAAGVEPLPFAAERLVDTQHDLLVDALLGTGLSGEPRAEYRAVIDWINASALPVLALDLPSGLDADTGRVWGAAVRADLTIAFIAAKRGMLTGAGPDHCGLLGFADLELPGALHQKLESEPVLRLTSTLLPQWLPRRPRSAHKGMFGHLLIIGGNHGYGGAVSIAAEAALRAGAGLVTIATRGAHLSALLARRPEAMVRAVESGQDLEPLLALPTVILLGPGLGQDAWAEQMVQRVLGSDLPLVVDADGLNLLARRATPVHRENWILTPHPGEAARLLGCDSREVEADRFAAVQQLAERHGGVALLKGAGTLVASAAVGGGIALCAAGNPGMASGGMGDLLSGLIAALLAQQLSLVDAARAGVLLHAMAGDEAAGGNERGLLATDLLAPLRRWVNPL
jgi:NAD(P)H-hydrate epimerase